MNVLLIYGGQSPEHEVSIRSAKAVDEALRAAGHKVNLAYITSNGDWQLVENISETTGQPLAFKDCSWQAGGNQLPINVAFPLVHGTTGEDGQLQKELDATRTPYVGCGASVSELCFDKVRTKETLTTTGIAVSPGIVLKKIDAVPGYDELIARYGNTLFIKPSRGGSSVGVSKVTNAEEYTAALIEAFKYDDTVLTEQAIPEPRELEVAVLEFPSSELKASDVGEIFPGETFYSYDDKYASTSGAKTTTCADLPEDLHSHIQATAIQAAQALGCRGLVRVDFLYSTSQKQLYLNEVNTLPGFTSISMYPQLWAAAGLPLPQLCDQLIKTALTK